jgi:glycosyltransferase involved in cell wall biosynthesis
LVEHYPNRGYGGSLKAGFNAAKKDIIIMAHSDNQFDISELSKMLDLMNQSGADMVSGIRENDSDPIHRRFIRWLWNTGIRALFGYLASDIDCGFKVFKREVLKKINTPSNGAMFDTQLLAGMRARNMKIVEIPVTHLPRTAGAPTGGNIRVWVKAWRELLVFWWQLKSELMVERGLAVFRWEAIAIGIILLVAAFARLYKIDQHMTFLGDEGRDVSIVREMILGRKFALLGPGTSVGNMYLGPLYYYMMVPSLYLFGMSPVGPAVAVVLLGVATIGLLWWWSRQLVDRTSALLLSTLYSLSPTVITYSHSSWNPNIMPFFALLTMYGVWKVWRYGYWRWLIISAISFAFVLNSHYLGLLLAPAMALFVFFSPKEKNYKKYLVFSFIVFALLMSPLFFFDLRHNWMNLKNILVFFTNRQATVNFKVYKAIPNLFPIWREIIDSLWSAKNMAISLVTAIIGTFSMVYTIYKKPGKDFWFIFVWILVGIVGLGLYKQQIYDHYFGFLYPAMFLVLGFVFGIVPKKVAYLFTILMVVNFIYLSPIRYESNRQLERTQAVVNSIIEKSSDQPFNLALISNHNYDMSYRYLLDLKDSQYKSIHKQIADQLFVICEGPCQPINSPLWEVAAFGWSKIEQEWSFPWDVKLYRLVHNPDGKTN